MKSLTLYILPFRLAVCHLQPQDHPPPVPEQIPFCSITRTPEEVSLVLPENRVPDGVRAEKGWRCLQVEGPLDFSQVGILAALATPLAEAGVSLFVLSTFDTDYLLVRESDFDRAKRSLMTAGHRITEKRGTSWQT